MEAANEWNGREGTMPRKTDDECDWKLFWRCGTCGHMELYEPVTHGPLGPWARSYPLLPRRLQGLLTHMRYAIWRRRRNGCECSGRKP